jgi:hypothetical protein
MVQAGAINRFSPTDRSLPVIGQQFGQRLTGRSERPVSGILYFVEKCSDNIEEYFLKVNGNFDKFHAN